MLLPRAELARLRLPGATQRGWRRHTCSAGSRADSTTLKASGSASTSTGAASGSGSARLPPLPPGGCCCCCIGGTGVVKLVRSRGSWGADAALFAVQAVEHSGRPAAIVEVHIAAAHAPVHSH